MMELIGLYAWTLLAGVLMAPALALIGAQLSARDQAMQSLVLSQASALGVVLGLAIGFVLGRESGHDLGHTIGGTDALLPTLGAVVCGSLAFGLLDRFVPKTVPSRNSHYVTAFVALMALTFLVTSLTPQLESHMSTVYFGDLAVATEREAMTAAALGALSLGLMVFFWRSITDDSFQLSLFGTLKRRSFHRATPWLFLTTALVTVGVSIQILGLLFSVSCLFVPTALLARRGSSLLRHGWEIAVASVIAATGGILLSLGFTQLPSVPSVVVFLIATSLIVRWIRSR